MYGDSLCYVEPSVLVRHSKAVVFTLLDFYMHRIYPILITVHGLSLRTLLLENFAYTPAQEVLRFGVFFTAVCSLEENESNEIVGEAKSKTLAKFRPDTEPLLSKANLLTTADLAVLQAYVIHLVRFLVSIFSVADLL
jgi:hypothetical protein